MKNVQEKTHPRGTVYEQGDFTASDGSLLEVCLVEIGPGNAAAARETERAISHFNPNIAVFVGVAGGLKDVEIGDVVVATKVYGYESGKVKREFLPRPQVHDTAYELQQRARAEAKREDWLKRVKTRAKRKFKVLVGPIASGEKVLASSLSAFSSFLRNNYGDALAVEMESWGFLDAIYASADVRGLVVRGISDLIDSKSKADASGSQLLAAKHASAFAFEVLSKLTTGRSKQTAVGQFESIGARGSSDRPQTEAAAATPSMFRRVARIEEIVKDVVLGKNQSSVAAAMEVIKTADESGRNEVLQELLNYQDCEDQDLLWKALPTIEACAELAPHFFTHAVLNRMANNSDFSVRSSAASSCRNLAQVAPDRVPVDILLKLSVHTEDWYVETPANAALKAMVRQNPAVLHIFFARLSSQEPGERAHAADALVEIAKREPEVLDPDELKNAVSRLRSVGDKITAARLAKLLPRVKRSPRLDRYKYGL